MHLPAGRMFGYYSVSYTMLSFKVSFTIVVLDLDSDNSSKIAPAESYLLRTISEYDREGGCTKGESYPVRSSKKTKYLHPSLKPCPTLLPVACPPSKLAIPVSEENSV